MARPAVPDYLGNDFADCPPGHRFNLYFPIWEDDWKVDTRGKSNALRECCAIPASAKDLLRALRERQLALAEASGALVLVARSLSPFATGLGNEHPVENGFAFLAPYGLPYLAGSGVKGVLRASAQELAREQQAILSEADVEALFGKEPPPGSQDAERGALICWDVFPQCAQMSVEIMTPHHGGYYQEKGTPNDAGQPNPIPFLAVPHGAVFQFVIQCDEGRLDESLRPRWRELVTAIFKHACDWRGFGAKTAVGYGALEFDLEAQRRAEEKRAEERRQAEKQAALASMTPTQRDIEEFRSFCAKRAEQLSGNKEAANAEIHTKARDLAKTALASDEWSDEERLALAQAIEEWLPKLVKVEMKEERKKLKLAALRGQA